MLTGKSIGSEIGRNKTADLRYEELKNRLKWRIRHARRLMDKRSKTQFEVRRSEFSGFKL